MGKNIIVFRTDNSSSVHIDNKGKDILILGERPTQGLNDTTLAAEAQPKKRVLLSLCNNGSSSFIFANATKICQFKAKYPEIKYYTLC